MKKINIDASFLFNPKGMLTQITRSKIILQAILVGLIAGILVVLFKICIEGVAEFLFHHTNSMTKAQYIFLMPIIGALGGLISGLLVYKIAPEAKGSGIPYVRMTLARIGKGTRLRSILVKFFSGIAGIGTGLSLGREGPSVQLGSGAGALVAKIFKMAGTDQDKLIAAGSGSAIAATFNAPIAGTIFVLEELMHVFSSSLLFPVLIATITASTFARHFLGNSPSFIIPEITIQTSPESIPVFIILGIITGILGVLFSKNIIFNLDLFDKMTKLPNWFKPSIAGFAAGVFGLFSIYFIGTGNEAINALLLGKFSLIAILLIFIGKFILTAFCFGSGASGGIFLPTLMLGSFIGYLIGLISNTFIGIEVDLTVMALIGMGAFLSSVVRTPITAVVIVFEMTGDYTHILPLMFTAAIADLVAEKFNILPIYSALIFRQNNNDAEKNCLTSLKVKDKMSKEVQTINQDSTLVESLKTIQSTLHCGFPVVSKHSELVGIITKSDIEDAVIQGNKSTTKIQTIMNPNPTTINGKENLYNALYSLHSNNVGWLIVTNKKNQVEGVITRFDIKNLQ